jgi:hypothetical protein
MFIINVHIALFSKLSRQLDLGTEDFGASRLTRAPVLRVM